MKVKYADKYLVEGFLRVLLDMLRKALRSWRNSYIFLRYDLKLIKTSIFKIMYLGRTQISILQQKFVNKSRNRKYPISIV